MTLRRTGSVAARPRGAAARRPARRPPRRAPVRRARCVARRGRRGRRGARRGRVARLLAACGRRRGRVHGAGREPHGRGLRRRLDGASPRGPPPTCWCAPTAPAGDVLWRRVWTWPGRGDDDARAVARDRRGAYVVAGSSGADWLVLKYSRSGYLQWVRRARRPLRTLQPRRRHRRRGRQRLRRRAGRRPARARSACSRSSTPLSGKLRWHKTYARGGRRLRRRRHHAGRRRGLRGGHVAGRDHRREPGRAPQVLDRRRPALGTRLRRRRAPRRLAPRPSPTPPARSSAGGARCPAATRGSSRSSPPRASRPGRRATKPSERPATGSRRWPWTAPGGPAWRGPP